MRFKTGDVIADRPSWWLYGNDNEVVAWAGEMFTGLADAQTAATHFQYGAARARFELYQDRTGHWRWRAIVADLKVASSSETYLSEIDARRAANVVRDHAATATPIAALRRTAD